MDYKAYTNKTKYLLEMIAKGRISSPNQVAKKFACSERTVRRMINHLREEGHPIEYSKCAKKYFSNKK
jgi:predicted DNA-binding transcriptional regulator YafY